MVLVAGDAGVGKTRLLAELANQARQRGTHVLLGGCLEVGDVGLPYVPVIAALRSLAIEVKGEELLASAAEGLPGLDRLLPELAEQTATTAVGGDFDQLQVFDAVRTLLVRLAERAPVLLVLEDLHWADPSTRELLVFLHRTLHVGRVLMIGSYRADELFRRHPLRPWLAELSRRPDIEHLALGPFSRSELAEHLASVRGQLLPAAAVDRILARSEGNPFYAEELLAAGADQAAVLLPWSLAEVLLGRVEGLSDPAKQLLRAAAVAGRQVGHGLLAQAAGLSELELEQALREAIDARLVVADAASERYGFRHALLQEALYGDLLPSERVRLHATFARLLVEAADASDGDGMVGPAAELAYHCLASHDVAGALRASVQAAAEAEAAAAPAEVLRHLEQALALWQQVADAVAVTGSDRVGLLLRAAEAASDAGDRERAVALTQEAIEGIDPATEPLGAAAAYERLGHYLIDMRRHGFQQALPACEQAVRLIPEQPATRLRARASSTLALALRHAGRYDEARRWCAEAIGAARAVGSGEEEAEALATLAILEERKGRLAAALALYAQARQQAAQAHSARIELTVSEYLADALQIRGQPAAALAVVNEGIELAERAGLAWSPPGVMLRGSQCTLHYILGNWDASEQLAATFDVAVTTPAQARLSVLALPVEIGRGHKRAGERLKWIRMLGQDLSVLVGVAVYGAELACWQDDLDAARASIQAGLRAYQSLGSHVGVAVIWLCTQGLAAEADRAERARATGDDAQLAEATNVGRALLNKTRAAAGGVLDFGELADIPTLQASMVKAEAEWSRLEGHSDPARWQAAVQAFSYGAVYEVARCQWRLAEALLGTGRRDEAAQPAREAYRTAVGLRAEPLREALEALAHRAHVDLGVGKAPAGRAGLTPRELEVLRLLVAGKTNQQIAEALFISGKTASVHVTHILTKFGVHSRLQAAARARELGLDRQPDNDHR
jgi:DNA-binding CsgD family transcriptional regulator